MHMTNFIYPKGTLFKDLALGTVYQYIRPGIFNRRVDVHLVLSLAEKRIKYFYSDYLNLMTQVVDPDALTPLLEVVENHVYFSPSGIPFLAIDKAVHGQDCTVPMVTYQALLETHDKPAGTKFVLSESLFLKTFREYATQ